MNTHSIASIHSLGKYAHTSHKEYCEAFGIPEKTINKTQKAEVLEFPPEHIPTLIRFHQKFKYRKKLTEFWEFLGNRYNVDRRTSRRELLKIIKQKYEINTL